MSSFTISSQELTSRYGLPRRFIALSRMAAVLCVLALIVACWFGLTAFHHLAAVLVAFVVGRAATGRWLWSLTIAVLLAVLLGCCRSPEFQAFGGKAMGLAASSVTGIFLIASWSHLERRYRAGEGLTVASSSNRALRESFADLPTSPYGWGYDSEIPQILVETMDASPFLSRLNAIGIEIEGTFPQQQDAAQIAEELIATERLTRFQLMLICADLTEHLIIGDYIVQDHIGRGGMATVVRVKHRQTDHTYAMKLFENLESATPIMKTRFMREMEIVQELAHPNIAAARETGQADSKLFIAMEYVDGPNLSSLVRDKGPLTASTAIQFIRQAANALQYAHERGLVHRDVKPANLILGSGGRIKLVDLGLSRFSEDLESVLESNHHHMPTSAGQLIGTIDYMAPEQAHSLSDADARSDIYSLGCTLFFLLTGQTHLRGKSQRRRASSLFHNTGMRNLRDVRSGLPESLYKIVEQTVVTDPDQRIQSMQELTQRLDDCAIMPIVVLPPSDSVRVLLVEDSKTDAEITCLYLERTSRVFIPDNVDTLASAIEKLNQEKFDVVLLDLSLPDSEGPETVQKLRAHHPHIPVLVLTGRDDPEIGIRCIAQGADDFLPKAEIDVSRLERHILLTLSRHHTERRNRLDES